MQRDKYAMLRRRTLQLRNDGVLDVPHIPRCHNVHATTTVRIFRTLRPITRKIVANDQNAAAIVQLLNSMRRSRLVGRWNVDTGDIQVKKQIERVVGCRGERSSGRRRRGGVGGVDGWVERWWCNLRHAYVAPLGSNAGRSVPLVFLCHESCKPINDVALATVLVSFPNDQCVKATPVHMSFHHENTPVGNLAP